MYENLAIQGFTKGEPEGGYTVIVPSLPGCVTYGETVDEAKRMAKEAIELYIQTLKELGYEKISSCALS